MTLVVGAHPQNLSLSILARRPAALAALREKGLTFFIYGAGSQTIPLMKAGVLHLAGTGATPPILAKSEGIAAAVFGMSGPRPERGGLLVRESSGIKGLHDLRGKGIGLMPISWHTQFLAAELDAAGLRWNDVRAAEIIPSTAKDAFLEGLLDAIIATDPLYSQIAAKTPTRLLASPGATFTNRSVYWGLTKTLHEHPDAISALLNALTESDHATSENPRKAAALLAGLNGNSADEWLLALTSRPWGVEAPDKKFLAEQQAHADIFAKFALIPSSIDVTDTIVPNHFSVAT
jgi:ABC-type nitrate/sulfonate/bicarbonate transport system substrate-binding protein